LYRSDEISIALVGNPNVGKSTVFNAMTGSRQHTGNWSGKTVDAATGSFEYKGRKYTVVDLPGTYSLAARSEEEKITSDFLKSSKADYIVVVLDATCMERNLVFLLKVLQICRNVIICVNLLDEAERIGIKINIELLQSKLGVPVVGTSGKDASTIRRLKETIRNVADGFVRSDGRSLCDDCVRFGKELYQLCVIGHRKSKLHWFDRIAMGKYSGAAVLMLSLFLILWLTISVANYPSRLLERLFGSFGQWMYRNLIPYPNWLRGLLIEGVYTTTTKVIAAMLPPLIIFFPLFTLLEDLGFLPRAAFMLDHTLEKCGSCGKQVLTMSMGLGCNSVGVIGARIISSKRERLLAILTNSFIPCNGKFPALLILSSIYFVDNSLMAAFITTGTLLMCYGMTLLATRIISAGVLKENNSCFIMEMPPYRKPNLKKLLSHAVVDRVLFVTFRAVAVAAPTGVLLWLLHHIRLDGYSVIAYLATKLDPIASFLGLSGTILLAFILSFPANELFLPIACLGMSGMFTLDFEMSGLQKLFADHGFTWKNAVCTVIFLLFHWPCSTTCLTIKKETGKWKWMLVAMIIPTVAGTIICAVINYFIN